MTSISSNGTINTFYDNFIRIGSGISEIPIILRFREDLIENPVNRITILPKPERSRHCISEQTCMETLSPPLRDFPREGAGARGTGARRTA